MKKLLISIMIAITVLAGVFMSACAEKKPPVYPFYQLQEAYDNGYLTEEDIGQIAQAHAVGGLQEEMDSKIESQIKKAAANYWNTSKRLYYESEYYQGEEKEVFSEDNFTITEYCGVYGEYITFMLESDFYGFFQAIGDDIIAGYELIYPNSNRIYVWRIKK